MSGAFTIRRPVDAPRALPLYMRQTVGPLTYFIVAAGICERTRAIRVECDRLRDWHINMSDYRTATPGSSAHGAIERISCRCSRSSRAQHRKLRSPVDSLGSRARRHLRGGIPVSGYPPRGAIRDMLDRRASAHPTERAVRTSILEHRQPEVILAPVVGLYRVLDADDLHTIWYRPSIHPLNVREGLAT